MQDLVDPSQYLSLYPAAFAPLKSQFDLSSIQQLFSSVDFIGISAYASNSPNFTISQLESATYQFATEIESFGVDIPDLIFNQVGSACSDAMCVCTGSISRSSRSTHHIHLSVQSMMQGCSMHLLAAIHV